MHPFKPTEGKAKHKEVAWNEISTSSRQTLENRWEAGQRERELQRSNGRNRRGTRPRRPPPPPLLLHSTAPGTTITSGTPVSIAEHAAHARAAAQAKAWHVAQVQAQREANAPPNSCAYPPPPVSYSHPSPTPPVARLSLSLPTSLHASPEHSSHSHEESQSAASSARSSPPLLTTTAALDEKSVLADPFVPFDFKRINTSTVNMPLHADRVPTLDPEGLEESFVPAIGSCYCAHTHNDTKKAVHQVQPELRKALGPKRNHGTEPTTHDASLPKVDGIADLSSYIATFTTLLSEERTTVVFLYERYSQYNTKLRVYMSARADTTTTTTALLEIPGIADARPSIQPGDLVLLRPMRPLSLPMKISSGGGGGGGNLSPMIGSSTTNVNATTNIVPDLQTHCWSMAQYTVEIDSMVTNVKRKAEKQKIKGSGNHPHGGDTVYITWVPVVTDQVLEVSYPIQRFNVRFIPSTTIYERCLTALDWLGTVPHQLAMNMLFPNQAPVLVKRTKTQNGENQSSLDGNLNEDQLTLCQMVMHRTSHPSYDEIRPPMLLTGPAGTGKTRTMLQSIMAILEDDSNQRHCILVCAPSHSAADVVTTRLGRMYNHPKQIFRLYDSNRPIETVPGLLFAYSRQSALTGTFALPTAKELLQFSVIVCTCSDAHLLYRAGLTNEQLRVKRNCFAKYLESAVLDCNLSGGAPIGRVDEPHFTHLFIDEAAQATEPETLIPLSVVVDPKPGSRKAEIVLVGDPRQLGPSIYSSRAADCGLGRSFLERLLQRPVSCLGGGHPHMLGPPTLGNLHTMQDWIQYSFQQKGQDYLSVFLTMNYRGHPSFLMMPSALFYFDKLQSSKLGHDSGWLEQLRAVEALSTLVEFDNVPDLFRCRKQLSWPIHFRGVVGQDVSVALDSFTPGPDSWSNKQEAESVVETVLALRRAGVSSQFIGIMAPFRAQVVLLRKLLRKENLGGINVGTVENYQAVERDVIILSLTRSNPKFVSSDAENRMGVFCQPKRTNVALTRAENLLIVVGNPAVMVTDPIWRQWLWFCLRNGLWYGDNGGKEILDWVTANREYRSTRHLSGLDNSSISPIKFSTAQEPNGEDDNVVAISTLERMKALRPLNGEIEGIVHQELPSPPQSRTYASCVQPR